MNSINILKRQKAASKLENCYCDGTEEFPCNDIKTNMENLCYPTEEDNEIDIDGRPKKSGSYRLKIHKYLVLFVTLLTILFKAIEGAFIELFA